jgi:NADH-quinone oxidoreductase subunit G
VCPVGAITIRSESEEVFKKLDNDELVVVAQIAPAVRVALGEQYGFNSGELATGKITAALKKMGFAKVFDTSFAADLTVIEEGNEFIDRLQKKELLPQFTSCCPGWVKYAEQYYPELLDNLSSCRSPQQMFGSLARKVLPELLGIENKNLVIVSIMPCTAKKYEAKRPEFKQDGLADVDFVITSQELIQMIDSAGIRFNELEPESLDLPLGFKTGAGVLFGTTGGVTEAVLRYAAEKVSGKKLEKIDFHEVRGNEAMRRATIKIDEHEIRVAMVHGLKEAGKLARMAKNKECDFDIIEVMACPGGCVGGAGQPVSFDSAAVSKRAKGLYDADKMLQLHKAQENPYLQEAYQGLLKSSQEAHKLLHTRYQPKRRLFDDGIKILSASREDKVTIKVCVGTNCFVKGSQEILKKLTEYLEENKLDDLFEVQATFCFENCGLAPNIKVGEQMLSACSFDKVLRVINNELRQRQQ